jgi:glycosyltransferase involved in cell wall biosynthesis
VNINNPLVSVCIPVYNAEKYISAAIESILGQSYQNIEIIVVNDGSTDDTASILESFKVHGVKVFHQNNKGQCNAANKAFSHSSGDYIKFFDGDDLLSSNFIETQVNRLKGTENAIASGGWGRFYDNDLQTFKLNPETVWKDMLPIDWLISSLESGHNMMQCGLWLIPRNILSISGLWDERLSLINDFDFFIRVILASEMVLFAENTILYYRTGIENSLSGQKSKKAMESAFLSIKLGTEAILKYENSIKTREVCADIFQIWKYQFFPFYMDLYYKSEVEIKKLGGSKISYPSGGSARMLSKIVGWKRTKLLKIYFKRKVD